MTVEGPCECHLNCRDNGDGTCNIAYWPTECGHYTVNVTFNDYHITGSPFDVIIYPIPNLERVTVSGAGIEMHGKSDATILLCCGFFPFCEILLIPFLLFVTFIPID